MGVRIMGNAFGVAVNAVFTVLAAVTAVGFLVGFIKNRNAAEKSVSATVADKQTFATEVMKKSAPPRTEYKYTVTFRTSDGVMTFEVSEDTCKGCNLSEKGTLRYKGKRFVGFDSDSRDAAER